MIPNANLEYYGDETRWFLGTVISIDDPLHLGRVRVRIYGIHSANTSDIPNGVLPWAQIVTPITEGASSGIGANTGIKPMAQVYGVFLDGKNSQSPLVLGSIPKYEPTNIPPLESNFIDKDEPSFTEGPLSSVNTLPANRIDDEKLVGASNTEKAYNFFLSQEIPGGGLQPHQAAGIVGNLIVESNVDPLAHNVPEGSRGVAQWNPNSGRPDRLTQLRNFCALNNMPDDSLYAQLCFIKYELYVVPEHFGLRELTSSQDVKEACEAFERYYEKPASGTSAKRLASSRELLNKMETV